MKNNLYKPLSIKGQKIKISPNVSYIPIWFEVEHLKQWKKLIRGTVLDCGCGVRPYEELFAKQYKEFFGFDIPSRNPCWNPSSRLVDFYASTEAIPFADRSVDTIFCFSVLEHVPFNPFLGLQEMYRVLKPGGFLFISVPFTYNTHGKNADFWRWTRYGLDKHLSQAGFLVSEILEYGGFFIRILELYFKFYYTLLNALGKFLPFKISQNSFHNWLVQLPQRGFMFCYKPFFQWLYGYGKNFNNKTKQNPIRKNIREGMHVFTMTFLAIAQKPD